MLLSAMTLRSNSAWFCGRPGWCGNALSVATPTVLSVNVLSWATPSRPPCRSSPAGCGGCGSRGPRWRSGRRRGRGGHSGRPRHPGRPPGVSVAVGLTVGVEPVVVGEREEPVFIVPPAGQPIDGEPVGLHDVHAVERGPLRHEVAQVDPVGPVGPDRVEPPELRVDHDVVGLGPGPLDLQVALAEDEGRAARAVLRHPTSVVRRGGFALVMRERVSRQRDQHDGTDDRCVGEEPPHGRQGTRPDRSGPSPARLLHTVAVRPIGYSGRPTGRARATAAASTPSTSARLPKPAPIVTPAATAPTSNGPPASPSSRPTSAAPIVCPSRSAGVPAAKCANPSGVTSPVPAPTAMAAATSTTTPPIPARPAALATATPAAPTAATASPVAIPDPSPMRPASRARPANGCTNAETAARI